MKSEKKYYSIREVSKMLDIKDHVIRHWDSIDPKTKKLRIDDISIRTKGGTRFFNKYHIKKISHLHSLLKENGKRNYSLDLASKIISQNNFLKKRISFQHKINNIGDTPSIIQNYDKIKSIISNLKTLVNSR